MVQITSNNLPSGTIFTQFQSGKHIQTLKFVNKELVLDLYHLLKNS